MTERFLIQFYTVTDGEAFGSAKRFVLIDKTYGFTLIGKNI